MNLDRATLNFLNAFSENAKKEGQRLHDEGAVVQIFGNHLFVRGRVEEGRNICRVTLQLSGNEWLGKCACRDDSECPAVYATMLERLARGTELPEAPNEVGEKSLTEIIEAKLERQLLTDEDEFLSKLERRYRRFEIERTIHDHDLVRLHPRWEVETFDPLALWPTPPADIVEFWNYIAYAFQKRNLAYPEFMDAITDLDWAENQLRSWERDREVSRWQHTMGLYEGALADENIEPLEVKLQVSMNEARLLIRREGREGFHRLADVSEFGSLRERYRKGALLLDGPSELIWSTVVEAAGDVAAAEIRLENREHCQLLNRLFHQESLNDRIVTLDEEPFRRPAEPLRWVCQSSDEVPDNSVLQLVTAKGMNVPHVVRLLPGEQNLYLSDETLFPGPQTWLEDTLLEPRYEVPREVVETESGVAFLGFIGAELPEALKKRVSEQKLTVHFIMELSQTATGADSEHMVLRVVARNEDSSRAEELTREGWKIVRSIASTNGDICRYDRRALIGVPALLEPMAFTWDSTVNSFRTRITKKFPEKYTEWLEGLPQSIKIDTDEHLQTLLDDPLEASVSFEVVDQSIDWFDLKVVVNVEGLDLTNEEIRALVAARGGFVRMKRGGWLRLRMNLSENQTEAVSRIGLDPFDLTGETHRLHVLQLAEPLAREVFDEQAWEKIASRSNALKLKVRPAVPEGIKVNLRPYQVDGFHFLSYLASNHFGGILADDMGLGKTVQSLTWLLYLRSRAEGTPAPSLVVCPKSVLDVWANEVEKAAPELRVQVLRNRSDLDVPAVVKNTDILVMNYSQLRTSAEELGAVNWLTIILDEGQQIKNPDSKAAKAARQLQGQNRLVLTGTPIENRLLDIWSLMAFAMPGVLGNRKYFRERFDRRKDPQAQTRLTARLRPFLLRRTKKEVAIDLPPKTEEDVLCKMEAVQEQLYEEELERIQKVLLGLESDESLRKNSFVILQGLMRLRQICCHPGLISPRHLHEESAKMAALFYLVNQLQEEGHKVLVFSQFVTMLDIIRDRLEDENRPYSYLTGQTSDRQKVIEDFQKTKDPNVFLLSLKAGGSGLNLTAASYVVLYDPWWNPAVETQAIDRTHRIGQESKVMAYRLLVRDSVEEKIRVLQKQKKALITGVLGQEGFARNLDRSDLNFLFSQENEH